MATTPKAVPAFLAKHGIKSVKDNLNHGDEVDCARELVRLFGKEFIEAWNAEKAQQQAKAGCLTQPQPAN